MMRATASRALWLAAFAFSAAACSDPSSVVDPPLQPTISLSPTQAEVMVNGSTSLSATVQHLPGAGVIWRSSNTLVATVNGAGTVTGVSPGAVTITALVAQDTTVRATANVTVVALPSGITPPDTLRVLGLGAVSERYTGEVAVRGDWAYTSTWSNRGAPGNAIKIWNVAGNVPVLVDSLILGNVSTTGDVQISDDGALLVVATEYNPGSIVIFDRSNPAKPVQLARFSNTNTLPGVHTAKLGRVNGRHYAFLSVDPAAGVTPRLVIVDITNPAAPAEVFAEAMGQPFVHDVFVRDGILFAALWHQGMRIFDIGGGGRGGTPAAPVVIGNGLTATGSIHNIWWFHDPTSGAKRYAFLGEEGPGSVGQGTASGDIHVFDISDMSNPREVAIYRVPGAGTHNFWMDERSGILYAAYYNGGVRALDVRGDLGTCTDLQKTPAGLCDLRLMGRERGVGLTANSYVWGVMLEGTHLYASDMKLGLFKLDAAPFRR